MKLWLYDFTAVISVVDELDACTTKHWVCVDQSFITVCQMELRVVCMYVCMVSFGQGSRLLYTRPLYSRPIALTQEGRSQVDDVCECVHD